MRKVVILMIAVVCIVSIGIATIHYQTRRSEVSSLLQPDPPTELYLYSVVDGNPREVVFTDQAVIDDFHHTIKGRMARRQLAKWPDKDQIFLTMDYGYKGNTLCVDNDGRIFISEDAAELRNTSRLHWLWWKIVCRSSSHITYFTHPDPKVMMVAKRIADKFNGSSLKADIDEKIAYSMAHGFCGDMAKSWLKLEPVNMSHYLKDTLDTHLALKWMDFEIADRRQNKWKQLISVDDIVVSSKRFEKVSDSKAIYEGFAEIRYTPYDRGVTGIGISLTLGFEEIDGTWMITSADTIGASVYREWKERNYSTIEEMDQAFINSCKERGILVAAQ